MINILVKSAVLFSSVAFSSAVIAHSLAIPHSHDNAFLFEHHYWSLGLIGFAAVALIAYRVLPKSK